MAMFRSNSTSREDEVGVNEEEDGNEEGPAVPLALLGVRLGVREK